MRFKSILEKYLSGQWEIEDVIEAAIDECSTAASVGSGTARRLPIDPDEQIERVLQQYHSYQAGGGGLEDFLDQYMPGAPEELVKALKAKTK